MADVDPKAPVLGEQGEPCQECGAPLAADQRYCLNCGKRRTGPRVNFRRLIGAPQDEAEPEGPKSPQGPAPAPAESPRAERDFAPLAAVGGIAVLGLMLLVGVLIGKGSGSPAATPAPIVRVGGEVGGGTASAAEPEKPRTAAAKPKGSKSSKGGGTGGKAIAGGLTGSAAHSSEATVQASTDDLEDLNSQSGESYEDTIKKLPDKIATPGKPPPIDTSKAPGGGGAAETIE